MDQRVYYTVVTVLLLVPFILILLQVTRIDSARFSRLSRMDPLWDWLGKGARSRGSGRVWTGTVDGRRVRVDFFEDTTEVRVEARPRFRVGFGREDEPQSIIPEARAGGQAFTLEGGEVGYADQPARVPELVGQPGVEEALRMLLAADGESLRSVDVDPEAGVGWFARNLPERRFGREDAERWVRAVVAVATASETVSP